MTGKFEELMSDPEGRRAFEEELLVGEVTDTLVALLQSFKLTQRELGRRLGVSDGRVSQMLAGSGNLTVRSLAAVGWALGMRFELQPKPMVNRNGTPAMSDPPAPAWLRRLGGSASVRFDPTLRVPDQRQSIGEGSMIDARTEFATTEQQGVAA